MIVLAFLVGERLPPRKPNDRVDLICTWIFQISLVVFLIAVSDLVCAEDEIDQQRITDDDFFHFCSGGKLDGIRTALEQNPDWLTATTANGEHCLHLTGIFGHSDVTEYVLQQGADPNVRSTYSQGLRMHPLSWNVYGGHIDNIRLLLKHGADANLDFDAMGNNGKVTAMDIALQLVQNEQNDERFVDIVALLKEYDAKTFDELESARSGSAEL
mmetsp:Transcript_19182/g.54456  ORF Transcript_19182/g.54456 Transcript_19182/m.54456 type:complete len:214 (+) Transcript_19182:130-771(+)|eukprot:CAMPEP_0119567230 /NCGR_PEP_ID=MMETSP1352-20130426/35340_1 /TAXON_ID=265584 /ORGANISM="Stauroneis constricta, Strain CCMP1120" /LENGTH=213 /DNA_ID=CAMNT_0007616463 /DNA_START=30 /DNA_END=671 /DNA_ORIENTATION=-